MNTRRSRGFRRLVSAAAGTVLVGGILGTAPAAASAHPAALATAGGHALVTIVAPAAQATVTAATVPVVLQLHGGARASTLGLSVNGSDMTKAPSGW